MSKVEIGRQLAGPSNGRFVAGFIVGGQSGFEEIPQSLPSRPSAASELLDGFHRVINRQVCEIDLGEILHRRPAFGESFGEIGRAKGTERPLSPGLFGGSFAEIRPDRFL